MVRRDSLNSYAPAGTPLLPVPPRDPFDVSLTDTDLRDEVETLATLMEAANASDGALDQATIDGALFGPRLN